MSYYPLPADAVLVPDFLPRYQTMTGSIYKEIVPLNTTLYIVNKIIEFPYNLFGDAPENVFFYMTVLNGTEIAVGIAYKLLLDTDRRSFSLLKLKNTILRNVRQEHRARYTEHLRSARMETSVQHLLPRVEALRNSQVGHLGERLAVGDLNLERPSVRELDLIRVELNRLYACLSFNLTSFFVPLSYSKDVINPSGSDPRPDIVRLLDRMAFDSSLLHMPEREPRAWPYALAHLSEGDVAKFNEYRRRAGLPEVGDRLERR